MEIEELWENEPRDYFEHCYMVEQSKENLIPYPENKIKNFNKKIFINLGSQHFETSTLWFKENYPHMKDFDNWEIYCFECDKSKISGYEKYKNIKVINKAVYNYNGYVNVSNLGKMATVNSEDGKSGNYSKITIRIPCINFIEFVKNNFSKDDFILVKCDIEGSEFAIIDDIISNPDYIKELFIEFHYNSWINPGIEKIKWIEAGKPRIFDIKHKKTRHPHFRHTFDECKNYMKLLREKNIFAHWWH